MIVIPEHIPEALPNESSRVLVILLDSVQKNILFSDTMPFVNSIRSKGTWGVSRVVSVPLTTAGDEAIFASRISNPIALVNDFTGNSATYSNIFYSLQNAGKRCVITGNRNCLWGVFGKWAVNDLNARQREHETGALRFGNFEETARIGFENALKDLESEKWDFAAVQLVAADYVGHLKTPRSTEYLQVCRALNDQVRALIALTSEQDYVLITSEHGMDDNGFHEEPAPTVIDTGFILIGPNIVPSGPQAILNIDLASTLSLLSGVSPFYGYYSLPLFDTLEMDPASRKEWLDAFSHSFTKGPVSLGFQELRSIQRKHLSLKCSPLVAGMTILLGLISAVLLLSILPVRDKIAFSKAKFGMIVLFLALLIAGGMILSGSDMALRLIHAIPFSANFITSHFIPVSMTLLIAMIFCGAFPHSVQWQRIISSFAAPALITAGFLSLTFANPYHPLNWLLFLIPPALWALTRRKIWVVVWGSFILSLALRRLTFYESLGLFSFPSRPVLCLAILAIYLLGAFLWRSTFAPNKSRPDLAIIILSVLSVFLFNEVDHRLAFLVALCGIALFLHMRRGQFPGLFWGCWVAVFFLGTSGSDANIAHLSVLPLFALLFRGKDIESLANTGFLIFCSIWFLYFAPGNAFDFKLTELSDPLIMAQVEEAFILPTVLVIVGRHLIPGILLIVGLRYRCHLLPAALSACLGISILAASLRMGLLTGQSFDMYPWMQFQIIIVICLFITIIVIGIITALILEALFSNTSNSFNNEVAPF